MFTHELARARHAELRAEASRIRLARRVAKQTQADKKKH
jgi:hypothetical protein